MIQNKAQTSGANLTEADIFAYTCKAMAELFEADIASLTPASRLREDLDIDSIDAVDLLVELKKLVGFEVDVKAEQFWQAKTVQDIVDMIVKINR